MHLCPQQKLCNKYNKRLIKTYFDAFFFFVSPTLWRRNSKQKENLSLFIFSPHNPCFKSLYVQEHIEVDDKLTNIAHLGFTHGHHTDLIWSFFKFLYVHRCYGSKCDYGLLLIDCRDITMNKTATYKKGGKGWKIQLSIKKKHKK